MNDKKIASILNELKRYFGFLFEMGFEVRSVDYHPESAGYWEVILGSKDCFLEISDDRGEIMVCFIPSNGERRYRIGLYAMIYYLTQGQKFIDFYNGNRLWEKDKQFAELARVLKDYIDKIALYFGDNFHEYREELLAAQRSHFDRSVNRRMETRKK